MGRKVVFASEEIAIPEIERNLALNSPLEQFDVLGVRLAALQIPELIERMEGTIRVRQLGNLVIFANVHVITEAQHDTSFKTLLNDSFTVPDGKPVIWLGRRKGFSLARRVYGPDLMIEFFKKTAGKGYRHFFYGGVPGVGEELAKIVEERYNTKVVGVYSPPFRSLTAREGADAIEMINRANPDILWVGLGCPKQERWAYSHRHLLRVPVINAVGQAFDIHSGRVRQAPFWMRERGLEWLYRLLSEPRRLWKRYLLYNSEFIWRLVISRTQNSNYEQS